VTHAATPTTYRIGENVDMREMCKLSPCLVSFNPKKYCTLHLCDFAFGLSISKAGGRAAEVGKDKIQIQ
jgi:hypothetical protein